MHLRCISQCLLFKFLIHCRHKSPKNSLRNTRKDIVQKKWVCGFMVNLHSLLLLITIRSTTDNNYEHRSVHKDRNDRQLFIQCQPAQINNTKDISVDEIE